MEQYHLRYGESTEAESRQEAVGREFGRVTVECGDDGAEMNAELVASAAAAGDRVAEWQSGRIQMCAGPGSPCVSILNFCARRRAPTVLFFSVHVIPRLFARSVLM